MRAIVLALLALIGCDVCPQISAPSSAAYPETVIASGSALTAAWTHHEHGLLGANACDEEIRIATGSLGQPLGPVATLSRGQTRTPVAGAHGSLWLESPDCTTTPGTSVRLVAAGTVSEIQLSATDLGFPLPTVAFDGVAYHAFWARDGALHHRAIGEDGAIGPDQVLPLAAPSGVETVSHLRAAHDTAGQWFLALDEHVVPTMVTSWGLRVDLAAQTTTRIWSTVEAQRDVIDLIWFDGAFRLLGIVDGRPTMTSIRLDGTLEEHAADRMSGLVAGTSAIYGVVGSEVGVFDAALTKVVPLGIHGDRLGFALLAETIVVLEHSPALRELSAVGRTPQGAETARSSLEADGPLESYEDCPSEPYEGD